MTPVAVRRINAAFGRRAVRWTAAAVVLVLLAGAGLAVAYGTDLLGRGRGMSPGVSALVRPGAPAVLELPGVHVEVPAGAVSRATTAHLTVGGADPLTSLPAAAARLLEPIGQPIQIDLSGQQPQVPIVLVLDVAASADPTPLVLLARHGTDADSLVGTYDPAGRRFTASLTRLSGFRLAAVRPDRVIKAARDLLTVLLGGTGIAGTKPGCAGKPATLADGRIVWIDGVADKDQLWPCLTVHDDRVALAVHSGSAVPWRVRTGAGSYDGAAEVQTSDVITQALYEVLVADRKHNDGLIVPQGEGHWQVPASALPVTVQAAASGGAWFAEVGVFVPMFLADLASGSVGTAAEFAKRFKAVLDTDGWDCLMSAAQTVADGVGWTVDTVINLTRTALRCVDRLAEAVFRAGLTAVGKVVVAVFGTGLALVWGGLQIAGRNFLDIFQGPGTNTTLTWKLSTTGGIAPFVGEWHSHGAQMVIKTDRTGTELWNAGPCGTGDSLCVGHSTLVFTLAGDSLSGRVTDVRYTDQTTGEVRTDADMVASGPHAGDTFRLTVADKGVLRYASERFPGGNPYLCGAAASQQWHNQCNA